MMALILSAVIAAKRTWPALGKVTPWIDSWGIHAFTPATPLQRREAWSRGSFPCPAPIGDIDREQIPPRCVTCSQRQEREIPQKHRRWRAFRQHRPVRSARSTPSRQRPALGICRCSFMTKATPLSVPSFEERNGPSRPRRQGPHIGAEITEALKCCASNPQRRNDLDKITKMY